MDESKLDIAQKSWCGREITLSFPMVGQDANHAKWGTNEPFANACGSSSFLSTTYSQRLIEIPSFSAPLFSQLPAYHYGDLASHSEYPV